MDRAKYEIEIKHHVFIRAIQRGINPDIIESIIMNGKVERYGKNYIKFITRSYICVGEISGLKIKILTIECKEEKNEKMF